MVASHAFFVDKSAILGVDSRCKTCFYSPLLDKDSFFKFLFSGTEAPSPNLTPHKDHSANLILNNVAVPT